MTLVGVGRVLLNATNETPTIARLTAIPVRPGEEQRPAAEAVDPAIAISVASTLTSPTAYSVAFACCSAVVNPARAKISFA